MRRIVIIFGFVLALCSALPAPDAHAQNPICPTAPPGDSSNRCASTAFVQTAVSSPILLQNHILVGQPTNLAGDVALTGDCTIVSTGVITCTTLNSVAPGALFPLNVGAGLSSSGGDLLITDTVVAGGPTGSSSVVPVITWNSRGQLIGVTTATITPAAIGAVPISRLINTTAPLTGGGDLSADRTFSIASAALTKTDDTNVTLTLGGTPSTALLQPTSLTLGWTGRLALSRFAAAAANSKILGSGASGVGSSYVEITLGTNLAMSGTTLNATGGASTSPTSQVFTSGSGTYNTPVGATYLVVYGVGDGGGSGGSGTGSPGTGNAGGGTTFSTLTAAGGSPGSTPGAGGGVGGVCANATYGLSGGQGAGGGGGAGTLPGGFGGGSTGAPTPGAAPNGNAGIAGAANTGRGAGGPSAISAGTNNGNGGGGGAQCWRIISSPSASYSYAVGPGGTGGAAGTNGQAGATGGSGYLVVLEYY